MNRQIFLCLFLLVQAVARPQDTRNTPGKVASRIESLMASGTDFKRISLFSPIGRSATSDALWSKSVRHADLLTLDSDRTSEMLIERPAHIALEVQVEGETITLDLERVDITAAGFSVIVSSDGSPVNYEEGVHYRGMVHGELHSIAAISVFPDEVMGLVSSLSGCRVIGKLKGDTKSLHIVYLTADQLNPTTLSCATADDGHGYSNDQLAGVDGARTANCVRLYWEVNYDIYQAKGSVANATNYVTGLFNESAALYANDGISVTLSQVYVWNTTSPYTGTTIADLLSQFQNYRNSFNGDLAHLLGNAGNGGKAAGFSGLCNGDLDESMCYSDVNNSYELVPDYSWSVNVVTHEQGHLLGSRHTHACVWNGNNTAIDGCGPTYNAMYTEGTCATGPIPSGGGTIMSYCHLLGVGIDFANGFGTQPRNVIQNSVNAAGCLSSCNTAPPNDACSAAIGLTSHTNCVTTAGTVEGANPDGFPDDPPFCDNSETHPLCGIVPDMFGVFYTFTAVSNTHTITVDPVGNGTGSLDPVIVVYTGNNCFNLQVVDCEDTPGGQGGTSFLTYNNFVVGTEYWVRIYDWCSASNVTNGDFEICITHSTSSDADVTLQNIDFSPAMVSPGMAMDISVDQCYSGTDLVADLSDPHAAVYFSTSCDISDAMLYVYESSQIGADDPCDGETFNPQLVIPTGISPGTYYLIFKADQDNDIDEGSNEGNNETCIPITVCPALDLVPTVESFSPDPACAGSPTTVHYHVENTGCTDATSVHNVFYFSNDAVIDGGDFVFGASTLGTIVGGIPFTEDITLNVPGSSAAGTWYVIMVVDPDNNIDEDGSNNTFVMPITINAPPVAAAISGDLSVCPGGSTELTIDNYDDTAFDYLWSTGSGAQTIVVTTPGPYSVIVTSGQCPQSELTEVTVNAAPGADAGSNGGLTLCSNSASVNLLTSLGGSPDAGGSWMFSGTPHAATFTPGVDAAGVYTYTVTGTAPCPDASATVIVSVNPAPNAGGDGAVAFCESGAPSSLFTALSGSPNGGGTWVGPGGAFGGTYDPLVNSPGTYTYTVSGIAPCANDQSVVTVTETQQPDAGTNSAYAICQTSAAENLLLHLGGSPDAGGSWSGPGGFFGGFYDPLVDVPGVYTYAINGVPPCSSASASVTVSESFAASAGLDAAITLCSNDPAIVLFSQLGGTPNTGGSWTGPLGPHGSLFTPGTDPEGTYTYAITGQAPCPADVSDVTVSVDQVPAQPIPIGWPTLVVAGGSPTFNVTPDANATGYEWSTIPSDWTGSSSTASITYTVVTLPAQVCVRAVNNDCEGPTYCATVNADVGTSITTHSSEGLITLMPNPSSGEVFVVPPANLTGTLDIEVLNGLGQLIHTPIKLGAGKPVLLDMSADAQGLYFIRCSTPEATHLIELVIQH